MKFHQPIILFAILFSGFVFGDEKLPPKPTSFSSRQIEGWTVELDNRLFEKEHDELGKTAVRLLENQLYQVAFHLPPGKVKQLQKIRIRLDLTHGKLKSAQYHPNPVWLRDNGYSEKLAKCVHIPDAKYFTDQNFQRIQPWAVLHELTHGYHDQFLEGGFQNPAIRSGYEEFMKSGKYENTLHVDGYKTKHYARTDPMEFFAEFTESYFGSNDFFPFNRGELKQDAPEIEKLIRSLWID